MRLRTVGTLVVLSALAAVLSPAARAAVPTAAAAAPAPVMGSGEVEIRIEEGAGAAARTAVYRLALPDEHGVTGVKLFETAVVDGKPQRMELTLKLQLTPGADGRPHLEYLVRRSAVPAKADKSTATASGMDLDLQGSMALPAPHAPRTLARLPRGGPDGTLTVRLELAP